MLRLLILPIWLVLAGAALAQVQVQRLERIEVVGEPEPALGNAGAASAGEVPREKLLANPAYRPGEVLETVPGLIVTQHSGEGKANQYFLRGFNLDHGTDLAITVDGMPVNMRTHGHAQGYADVNFLMPELLRGLAFRKGPYDARDGDFASAGALYLDLVDTLPGDLADLSVGSFGYGRGFAAGTRPLGAGTFLVGAELVHNDGPWTHPDDFQKANAVMRWSRGTLENGVSVTGMAYASSWNATNQIAQRAVDGGLIGRFGSLDPSDGGRAQRYSLSARWSAREGDVADRVSAYVIGSRLALYNNFTYFLRDPVNGDQIKQKDDRAIVGFDAGRTVYGTIGGREVEGLFGVQGRYDRAEIGLFNTQRREILSTVRADTVNETSIGLYGQGTVRWTDWVRTTAGLRGDVFDADVASTTAANSGNNADFIMSPKVGIVFGPIARTELYLNAGMGYHSNDARGATIAVDPNDGVTPLTKSPLLVRSKGAEIGLRTVPSKDFESSVAFFVLDFDSELVFAGDAGTTEASRPSRRIGIEIANHWKPASFLTVELDGAYARARFKDDDPAGSRIPGAVEGVINAGLHVDDLGPWFGDLHLRFFGPRPLIEDDSARSRATTLLSGRIGYRVTDALHVRLEGFNLLDARASQIDYFYASRLPGEPAGGVSDVHFHPVEPLSFRLGATAKF